MRVPALGEAALQLPWLSPCAASLLALARAPSTETWLQVRDDPGAVLLIVRQAGRAMAGSGAVLSSALQDPAILKGAVRLLGSEAGARARDAPVRRPGGFVDWSQPELAPVYRASLSYARLAHEIAVCTRRCQPETAWSAGLLAPLGWLALCAIDPEQVALCLADPALEANPIATQQRRWGNDQAAIARRLARRWRLPAWLGVVVGHLGLPLEIAQGLDADLDLLRVVQLAVALVQQQGQGLHLMVGADQADNLASLGISSHERERLVRDLAGSQATTQVWTAPQTVPLLSDLLGLAAENQRLQSASALEQLERDHDVLHHALEKHRTGEATRLRDSKLQALAEFAGGAAHEINNPLAVISGQAQYLLARDEDPARQRALQTIIGQAQRIHQLLTELMQFAKPARPKKQIVDLRFLLREVMLALGELALQKGVRLGGVDPEHALHLNIDAEQVRSALQCLLRNAIEAAPADGWANLRVDTPAPDRVDIIVEDNGPGPGTSHHDQLFDPFYSGRQAGRGRGLGLPTAWRLARQHGGDVRFEDIPGGPTRFVLSMPRELETNGHAEGNGDHGTEAKDMANGRPMTMQIDS